MALAFSQSEVAADQTRLDRLIIGIYFVFVLCIGAVLRKIIKSSDDYHMAGRSLPSWVTALGLLGANLGGVGALEIMGMGAARYGNIILWWGLIAVVFGYVILGMSLAPALLAAGRVTDPLAKRA